MCTCKTAWYFFRSQTFPFTDGNTCLFWQMSLPTSDNWALSSWSSSLPLWPSGTILISAALPSPFWTCKEKMSNCSETLSEHYAVPARSVSSYKSSYKVLRGSLRKFQASLLCQFPWVPYSYPVDSRELLPSTDNISSVVIFFKSLFKRLLMCWELYLW